MKKEARLLRAKAMTSVRRAAQEFNSIDDEGRVTRVLLPLQHSFEMLLKAGLVENGVAVFDKKTGRSLGFEKCLNLAQQHLKLGSETAGTLRAVDALRDDEQHYLGGIEEGLLYLHVRAAITAFDDILSAVFNEKLADHLPSRVLPISTQPPEDIDVLVGSEFQQIVDLLKPARRKRAEARQRIRTLLALEAHVAEDVLVSERDVDRVERGVRGSKKVEDVFPRLSALATTVTGSGISVVVRVTKKQGAPVRYVAADDPAEAAAVREVDLQRKYRYGRSEFAQKLGINNEESTTLREHLKLEDDPDCFHEFQFGASKHQGYSDEALARAKQALPSLDIRELARQRRARRREAKTG